MVKGSKRIECPSHCPARDLLKFDFGGGYVAREINVEEDRAAIRALGLRCIDYLIQTTPSPRGTDKVLRQFLRLIDPQSTPTRRGVLLGIFRSAEAQGGEPSPLLGLLYFLYPRLDPRTWHIALLLLEPAARGQGLGTAVHGAFARWAAARGAQRLTVTVSASNRPAFRFWRDRLGYTEAGSTVQPLHTPLFRHSYDLRYQLPMVPSLAPWVRL